MDVGAILLHSLGLAVPADFEGRVPQAVFDPGYLTRHPVRIGPATIGRRNAAAAQEMSEDDKAKVMAQLRMLGYME